MVEYLQEIFRLFYPERCAACGRILPEGVSLFCPHCQWDMPLTGYCSIHDNPVYAKFGGLIPVQEASSWLFFTTPSRYRDLIHSFKYRGTWKLCNQLGTLMGYALAEGGLYQDVDLILPVPLHPFRKWRRGYNQAEYLAEGIAKALKRPVCRDHLIRKHYNRSQATTLKRHQRWENVQNIFAVHHPEHLSGKHLLLMDDVLTTGATLISCAETLLKNSPDCRISIATLAVSAHELFGRHKGGGL